MGLRDPSSVCVGAREVASEAANTMRAANFSRDWDVAADIAICTRDPDMA
jgi:hypothetical protein